MIDRSKLRKNICEQLTANYVALIGQRGSGINALIDQIISEEPNVEGMKFICIKLPCSMPDFGEFLDLINQRLTAVISEILSEKIIINRKKSPQRTLQDILDAIDRNTSATYAAIVFHIYDYINEEFIIQLLSMLRSYHYTRKRGILRFLIAGGKCLWHLCIDKHKDISPFNIARIIFMEGLSNEELLDIVGSPEGADGLKELTDGIPSLVETIKLASESEVETLLFNRIEKNWDSSSNASREFLKKAAEKKDMFPTKIIPHYRCKFIPEELESSRSEAFWNGFFCLRNEKLCWRTPIHESFAMEKLYRKSKRDDSYHLEQNIIKEIIKIKKYMDKNLQRYNQLSWIHISDLHLNLNEQEEQDIILNKLLDDVEAQMRELVLVPNFIIFTGDLAFNGSKNEYELAKKFLAKLLQRTRLGPELLLIVPGNHDVNLEIVNTLHPTFFNELHNINKLSNISKYINSNDLFNSIIPHINDYQKFIEDFLSRDRYDTNNKYFINNFNIGNKNISIILLNSAWLAGSKNDKNNIILGESLICEAFERVESADIIILAFHHPIDWLNEEEFKFVEPYLTRKCHFILNGHLHSNDFRTIKTPNGETMFFIAGSCYNQRKTHYSYNLVDIDLEKRRGKISLRMYSFNQDGFWTKDNLSYKNIDGVYEFSLPSKT